MPLFSPFKKAETGNQYSNGGMRCMCPILVAHYETKSVWKDITNSPPDLVLSIGAGRNVGDRTSSSAGGDLGSPTSLYTTTSNSLHTTTSPPSAVIRQGRGGMGNYKRQNPPGSPMSSDFFFADKTGAGAAGAAAATRAYIVRNPQAPMLVTFNNPISGQTDRLSDQRACERTWNGFLAHHVARDAAVRRRYRRVCPELFSRLPKFDDVARLDDLEREAREVLRQNPAELVEIAHRLVASTFFFEKDVASIKPKASGFTCTGSIFCRFRPSEAKALAWFLISLLDGDFEPHFLLEEESEDDTVRPVRRIVLTDSILQDMHLQGNFQLEQIRVEASHENSDINISLCLQNTPYQSGIHALPISGFPRRLMSEDGSGVHQAVISMNSRSTIQRQPNSPNTDPSDTSTPTTASFSFSPSFNATPVSPLFSHPSFDKRHLGRNVDDLPELEG
ncbi:putative patatin-like serine protein [Rosellinia necatrix]|uniref:Putative patatin-like serine protein n=1 Tax=Rosellinia necatrix TaxID=77044 RepID=A0A1S8A5E6_ROSNE|nr:putative patatin-like serine protein [Rosellinia necatrix]